MPDVENFFYATLNSKSICLKCIDKFRPHPATGGANINITVPIQYEGETPERRANFNQLIQQHWNRQQGPNNISLNVTPGGADPNKNNRFEILPLTDSCDTLHKLGTNARNVSTHGWFGQFSGFPGAKRPWHEVGHMLGLPEYEPGGNNMMNNEQKNPWEWNSTNLTPHQIDILTGGLHGPGF